MTKPIITPFYYSCIIALAFICASLTTTRRTDMFWRAISYSMIGIVITRVAVIFHHNHWTTGKQTGLQAGLPTCVIPSCETFDVRCGIDASRAQLLVYLEGFGSTWLDYQGFIQVIVTDKTEQEYQVEFVWPGRRPCWRSKWCLPKWLPTSDAGKPLEIWTKEGIMKGPLCVDINKRLREGMLIRVTVKMEYAETRPGAISWRHRRKDIVHFSLKGLN